MNSDTKSTRVRKSLMVIPSTFLSIWGSTYSFFLNSLRHFLKGEKIYVGAETIQFIERVLPSDYLGQTTYKINDFRLRASPVGHGNLPTFKQIFNDRYFSPYKKAVVPIDISTIIKRNTKVKIPIARKKTMNEIKRNLASKNIKKTVLKRPGIRIQPKPVPKSVPKVVMTNNKMPCSLVLMTLHNYYFYQKDRFLTFNWPRPSARWSKVRDPSPAGSF